MSKGYRKVSTAFNYNEHLLLLVVIKCVLISSCPFFVGIPIGIVIFAVGLKTCTITVGIKKYKWIIKKKKKKHDEIVSLAKSQLHSIEVLLYRAQMASYISHYEFILVNKLIREFGDMKRAIKNLKTLRPHQRF